MHIRDEREEDYEAVYAVNAAAFETTAEAKLVEMLRQQARPFISLVAENEDGIIGHIMFSPVTLSGHPELMLMGLGPVAVAPAHQREGAGGLLIRVGLARCREMGITAVFLLGHPDYYPRFGFVPSVAFGIDSEYDVPAEAFMALELQSNGLEGKTGRVTYHPAFNTV